MKQDQRGKVIDYLNRKIPKDQKGDPAFETLGAEHWENVWIDEGHPLEHSPTSLLSQFSQSEIVLMVNRFLYQQEYQREFHRRMERRRTEELAPLKKKVKEMFNLRSWSRATPEQLELARIALRQEEMGLVKPAPTDPE